MQATQLVKKRLGLKANKLYSIGASEEVDAMEQAVAAEQEQLPKKKGGIFIQNRDDARSEVYCNKCGELSQEVEW